MAIKRKKKRFSFKGHIITKLMSEVESDANGYIVDGKHISFNEASIVRGREKEGAEFVTFYIN